MKIFRIVLVAALVALVGLPPVFGLVTESQVRERVESLNTRQQLSASIEEYDRGWFSSRAQISLAPPAQALAPAPAADFGAAARALLPAEPVSVAVDFKHGPISVQNGFFVGAAEFVARPADTGAGAPAGGLPFEFQGQTTFARELHFAVTLPPLDRENETGRLSFSGGRASGTLTGERLVAEAQAATLQLTQAAQTLSLQGLRASVDNDLGYSYISPGDAELTIERMSVDAATLPVAGGVGGIPMFDASGITFREQAVRDADTGLADATTTFVVRDARFGDRSQLTNARIEVTGTRLDTDAFEALRQLVNDNAGQPLSSDQAAPLLEQLLAKGPGLTINPLRFDVDGAPFEATVSVQTLPDRIANAGSIDLSDPGLWRTALRGRAEITAEKKLVERFAAEAMKLQIAGSAEPNGSPPTPGSLDTMATAQAGFMLAMLASQGLIEDTGSVYRIVATLNDGRLEINGNPVPLFGL